MTVIPSARSRRLAPHRVWSLTLVAAATAMAVVLWTSGCAGSSETTDNPGATTPVSIDPTDFSGTVDNSFFPLDPGTTYVYESEDGGTRIEVVVTSETRVIQGVTCVVVRDTVTEDGALVEDTFDWYAEDNEGNVWYFGEDTREYEDGQVVSTAGSWEAGVSEAVPGIIMEADPQVGDSYRQEYLKGEAEDMAEVLAVDETVSVPFGSFTEVLKTKEWTPLEPGVEEEKLYAAGVGLVKVEVVKGGSGIEQLIQISGG